MDSSSSKFPKLQQLYSVNTSADWSIIPDLVLVDILGRLKTLQDFYAVRAVCRNWRIAAAPSSFALSSQSPLLIFSRDKVESLYDVSARRLYPIRLPRFAIGYSHGHLITVASDYRFEYLANTAIVLSDLFTGAQIRLPDNPEPFVRVLLSARPDSADCRVVLYAHDLKSVQYLNVGDRCWTVASPSQLTYSLHDMMFFRGQLLALTREMEVVVLEMTGNSLGVRRVVDGEVFTKREPAYVCLGELDGVILVVRQYFTEKSFLFDAFLWNSEKNRWEEVLDLGDKALFVCKGGKIVRVSATELGLKNNCIYWTYFVKAKWLEFSLKDRSSQLVNIDDSILESPWLFVTFWVFPNSS